MKTQVFVIMSLCVLLFIDISMAQQKEPQANRNSTLMYTASSAAETEIVAGTCLEPSELSLEGSLGNIYIGENWPKGLLILKSGKMVDSYLFRYDIYADQMQFITGNDTLAFASPQELYSISFDGRTLVYEPYDYSGMLMKGYFELLIPGKKQLLLKRSVTYILPGEEKGTAESKDTYLISESFYLKAGNKPAQKVMCNRKSALVAMGDRQKELKDYLEKTGNKVRTLDDLKKMVQYYNSLE